MSTTEVEVIKVPHAPSLLHSSVLYADLAEAVRTRLEYDQNVREAEVHPGRDIHGGECFHIFYRPRFQNGRTRDGRKVRWEYEDAQ